MGVPTCLAVFVLCVVLSEPATAAGGQKASDGATDLACRQLTSPEMFADLYRLAF